MDVPKMLLPNLSRPRPEAEKDEFFLAYCSRQGNKTKIKANLSVTSKPLTPDYAKKGIRRIFVLFWKEITFLNCASQKINQLRLSMV